MCTCEHCMCSTVHVAPIENKHHRYNTTTLHLSALIHPIQKGNCYCTNGSEFTDWGFSNVLSDFCPCLSQIVGKLPIQDKVGILAMPLDKKYPKISYMLEICQFEALYISGWELAMIIHLLNVSPVLKNLQTWDSNQKFQVKYLLLSPCMLP